MRTTLSQPMPGWRPEHIVARGLHVLRLSPEAAIVLTDSTASVEYLLDLANTAQHAADVIAAHTRSLR